MELALKCQKVRNQGRLLDCGERNAQCTIWVFGDLYCHVVLETPVNLTEHQRKLLRSLMNQLIKIKKGIIRTAKAGWTIKGF